MTQTHMSQPALPNSFALKSDSWAPLPAALSEAVSSQMSAPPFTPITDDGRVRLGGQAPMFLPEVIADAGLVRLGGQSPMF